MMGKLDDVLRCTRPKPKLHDKEEQLKHRKVERDEGNTRMIDCFDGKEKGET